MSKINTILIDDEQVAIDSLRILLGEYPDINITHQITNPIDIFPIILKESPDLIFLDIQMPAISGIELLKKIRACNPTITVIIVTAHCTFALDVIKHNTFDYLLKPVSRKELKLTIERIGQYMQGKSTTTNSKVLISSNAETILIDPKEIVFFKASGNYTSIYLQNGVEHLVSYNMGTLIEKFPKDGFVRVSRSVVANKHRIVAVNRKLKTCTLKDIQSEIVITASTLFLREFNSIFNG